MARLGLEMPIIIEKSTDLSITELVRLLRAELAPDQEEDTMAHLLSFADRVQAMVDSKDEFPNSERGEPE